jgi:hypothetical protein
MGIVVPCNSLGRIQLAGPELEGPRGPLFGITSSLSSCRYKKEKEKEKDGKRLYISNLPT